MTLFPETMRTPRLRYERIDTALDAFERYEWTRASRAARERELRYVTERPDPHPKATGDDLDVASVAHFEGNENSQRQMEKWVRRFGGTEDGYFRNWVPGDGGDGEPWDLRSYSITADDYRDAGGAPEVELDPEDVPEPTTEPTVLDTDAGADGGEAG